MFVHLNIDIWLDEKTSDVYVKGKPEGVETKLIKAGTPIAHDKAGLFMRRIKDDKIIYDGSCVPEVDTSGQDWHWEGLAARRKLKRKPK